MKHLGHVGRNRLVSQPITAADYSYRSRRSGQLNEQTTSDATDSYLESMLQRVSGCPSRRCGFSCHSLGPTLGPTLKSRKLSAVPDVSVSAVAALAPSKLAAPALTREFWSTVHQLGPDTWASFMDHSSELDALVLVSFSTEWCGPCKLMADEMDKLARAFPQGVRFAKYDCGIPAHEDFATQQRIRTLPTFRLYYKSRCLDQVTGARPVQLRQLLVHYTLPRP
ncbi:thioredoxin-like protein [Haematococcus lacustris]